MLEVFGDSPRGGGVDLARGVPYQATDARNEIRQEDEKGAV